MKKLVILMILSGVLTACDESGGSGETEAAKDPGNPVQTLSCASGTFNTGVSNDQDLELNSDCTFRINQCGTTYEMVSQPSDANFTGYTNVTFKVKSYDFVQNGCLRPAVGDFQCQIVVYRDNGLNKTVLSLSCADENFYHTSFSQAWYQP